MPIMMIDEEKKSELELTPELLSDALQFSQYQETKLAGICQQISARKVEGVIDLQNDNMMNAALMELLRWKVIVTALNAIAPCKA